MKRKICFVTSSRADYGLLYNLIRKSNSQKNIHTQIVVTGMHLLKKFGLTYKEIIKDGFKINKKVNLNIKSDGTKDILKLISDGIIKFEKVIKKLKPDIVVLLGDRFEIFSFSVSALISRLPIAHIHGGESTLGAYDDALRHSITKMSHIHFASTNEYKKRILQLGENPKLVFNVGSLGVENISNTKLYNKTIVESRLNLKFLKKNLLITFHPVTLEKDYGISEFKALLKSLEKLKKTKVIFTLPNMDTNNNKFFKLIRKFTNKNKFAKSYISMGRILYLSCMKHVDAVIGNSSSGIIETPGFKKATINIGSRQMGRVKAKSIIDCNPNEKNITQAINRIYSKKFKLLLKNIKNPYAKKNTSNKILKVLTNYPLNKLIKKNLII